MTTKMLFALIWIISPLMGADAIEGSWKINKELSNVDKAQTDPPVRLRLQVSDKTINMVREIEGKADSSMTAFIADGKDHEAGGGLILVTQKKGSRGLQITGRKGGEVVSQDVYQVSRDQKTMRVTMTGTAPGGSRFSSVIWFDKAQ